MSDSEHEEDGVTTTCSAIIDTIKNVDLHHIDSEYDEELDIPDTVSVMKIADVPIQEDNEKVRTGAYRKGNYFKA